MTEVIRFFLCRCYDTMNGKIAKGASSKRGFKRRRKEKSCFSINFKLKTFTEFSFGVDNSPSESFLASASLMAFDRSCENKFFSLHFSARSFFSCLVSFRQRHSTRLMLCKRIKIFCPKISYVKIFLSSQAHESLIFRR